MARNKSAKQVTATINKSGFQATKKFMSTDADAWKQMVETTLAHIEKVDFDPPTYASGLAATVRGHGGSHTMEKWLHPEVPTEQWKKGLPYLSISKLC